MLSSLLKSINVKHVLSLSETEPDLFSIFGETEDKIDDWYYATEIRIEHLLIRASKEVSEPRSATHSGFRKLFHPNFNGDILNFLELKNRWLA